MTRPMISQPNSRYQFSAGSDSISSRQRTMPRIGNDGHERAAERPLRVGIGPPHDRAPRRRRSTNANSVPMLVSSSSALIGRKPGQDGHEHADQDRADPRRLETSGGRWQRWPWAPGRRGPSPERRAGRCSIMTSSTRRDAGHAGRGDDELGPGQAAPS